MQVADLIILPLLIPFFTAVFAALVNGRFVLEKVINVIGGVALCAWVFWMTFHIDALPAGVEATVLGGWDAPFGVAMVADRLACIMLCLSSGVGLVAMVYSFWTVTENQQKHFFYPLFQILILGCNWSFLSGDLFNLFVAYEVMLIGSYGMMMVGARRAQVLQTMKYIGINQIGSVIFVIAIGLLYATTGTTNFADMTARTAAITDPQQANMVTACSTVLMVVFALKTAAFPLIYWLPDTYPVVPAGINGFFAGILTKVGVYSLLRVFGMVFQQPGSQFVLTILLVLSGFTMLLGVLGAMCQWDIRRILSWHIISQVGYMVMGIGLVGVTVYAADGAVDTEATEAVRMLAIAGTIFYVVHHIVVKSCLFLVGGVTERVTGSQRLKQMGGVLDLAPGVAGLFLIASFSLAGMPPFSGFLAKFVVIRAGLSGGSALAYWIVAIAIITSFFTLYSMTKIWGYAFWGQKKREHAGLNYRGMMIPTGVLVVVTVVMGVWAQPFMGLANRAAGTLMNPGDYIRAVPGMMQKADEFDQIRMNEREPDLVQTEARR